MAKFFEWTVRLLYIWVLRVFSAEMAEGEIRKCKGELERAMWGPQTRKRLGGQPPMAGSQQAGNPPMARKVQQLAEWDTATYETDPVSGQSQVHNKPK